MKFVVTGMPGLSRCSRSRSAVKHSRSASELNRAKSSCCVGFGNVGAVRGGRTCSQSPYRWLQNAVPQASLSASRSPYRACSQRRNAAADVSQYQCQLWQPYSLFTCHMTTAG